MGTVLPLFFTYESDIPQDAGFSLFGAAHLIWLALLCLVGGLLLRRFRKSGKGIRQQILRILAWSSVGMILVRTIWLICIGEMTVYELPLHLCSLAGFLALLHLLTGWDWVGQVLYSACLPGAVAALLFPDWVRYPAIHFVTIEGFLFHAAVPLYIICALSDGAIQPKIRNIWKTMVFFLAVVPPIWVFNRQVSANYLFLNVPSRGSPLEWLAAWMGNPGYLIGYGILALAVILLMDVFWALYAQRKGKGRPA